MIHKQEPLFIILRLLILFSITNSGLPKKHFDYLRWVWIAFDRTLLSDFTYLPLLNSACNLFRRELLHSYGFEHMATLNNLEKAGLFRKQVLSWTMKILCFISWVKKKLWWDFLYAIKSISHYLRLAGDKEQLVDHKTCSSACSWGHWHCQVWISPISYMCSWLFIAFDSSSSCLFLLIEMLPMFGCNSLKLASKDLGNYWRNPSLIVVKVAFLLDAVLHFI